MSILHAVQFAAGAVTALCVFGAAAQPPRLVPPVDQSGPGFTPVTPLQSPADPAPATQLRPQVPAYQLEMEGVLESISPEEIRIAREGQPDALLTVASNLLAFLDGEPVALSAIPRGAQVRARFDLDGNERIAQRLEATSPGSQEQPMAETVPPITAEIPGVSVERDTPQELLPAAPRLDDLDEETGPLPGYPAPAGSGEWQPQ